MLEGGRDLGGIGGGSLGDSFLAGSRDLSRARGLSGMDGVFGGGGISTVTTVGVDFVPFNEIRAFCFSFSCCSFFGGKGGKDEGSKTGARILPLSIDGALEVDLLAPPFDEADIVDIVETAELADSVEPRRLVSSGGPRGGNG